MEFARFLRLRRSEETQRTYAHVARLAVVDPDQFIALARTDKREAEDRLMAWAIKSIRDQKLTAAYVGLAMSALKSFLDFYEVPLNWKRIKTTVPRARHFALDRAPSKDEITRLLEVAKLRDRALVLILASSGIRIGGVTELQIKDYVRRPTGIGWLRIYRGYPEEYVAFVSKEAADAIEGYLSFRKSAGELLNEKSPLIRDVWEIETAPSSGAGVGTRRFHGEVGEPKAPTANALQLSIRSDWIRCGIVVPKVGAGTSKRNEFKLVHGFRKFFKTNASRGVLVREDVEVLMGHHSNYYRPTLEHLENEYLKAEPYLTFDDSHLGPSLTRMEGSSGLPDIQQRLEELNGQMAELIRLLGRVRIGPSSP